MAETKKTVKKKKATKKAKTKTFKQRFFAFLWSFFWKSSLTFIALMVIAGIYFDKKIERRLDGSAWTLPAQVFARPLIIDHSQLITQANLDKRIKIT
ncbi:hypothetical protein ACLKMH_23795 [Psychromonas sp. KJ10-10]|uniref:hypothetical protein n=1 Tax=Psychromonas sp. KJ10-10 TaxID=3391823 RepID=UPI0039B4F85F